MSKYASKEFWVDALDRVVATVAQSAVGALTADATGLLDLDVVQVASVAGLAGVVALLTSVAFRGRETGDPVTDVIVPDEGALEFDETTVFDGDVEDPFDGDEPGKYGE